MGPGPGNPYPEVVEAFARPLLGHLDPDFLVVLDETCDRLRRVFQTDNALTLPISGTGSAGMEAAFSQSDLDWTIIRPPRLTNGPMTNCYRIMDGALPPRGFFISRRDVAQFMIGEAENPAHVREIVGLAD